MSKYTFAEFIAAQEGDDFKVIEPGNLAWAKGFVKSMGDAGNWVHDGDCTKQNVSCPLCVYELYLKEYREYYFSEGDIRIITFSCSESIHLYKKEGGYNPTYPYKPHNSMDEATTHLTNRGVKDIKIVKHYNETI